MHRLVFTGPARCYDSEEAAFDAVVNNKFKEGEVIVIRYEGPKAVRACARCCRPRPRFTASAPARRWR